MGRSYIAIPGVGNKCVRIDIAQNITTEGKIANGHILVYSEYNSNQLKKRSYSLIDELDANLKRLIKEGRIDLERGEIIDLKSEIANLYTDIKQNNEDTQVIAYERPGWIKENGIEYLAYSDFIFCTNKTEANSEKDEEQEDEVDHTFEDLDGLLRIVRKMNKSTVEVPYNTPIQGINHAKDAFCYGEEWVKHDWKIDGDVRENYTKYMTGKPKAQILFASNFNGIVYQALDLANVGHGDEKTLLSVTGPTGTGKTSFATAFKNFMFDDESFVDNKTTDSKADDHLKENGIRPTIFDDMSTKQRSTRDWISKIFDLASSTGRDTQRSKGIKIYSQIIASCEEESKLSKFIDEDRGHQKGSKFRLLEMMISASDFINDNENFTDVQNMFKQTNAGILKVFDMMVEEHYGIDNIVAYYQTACDVLKKGLIKKYSKEQDKDQDKEQDKDQNSNEEKIKTTIAEAVANRYSEKMAVYLVSSVITNEAFDKYEERKKVQENSDVEVQENSDDKEKKEGRVTAKNKVGSALIDIVTYIEEELEHPEEYINFPNESKGYMKALDFLVKMDTYLNKWSEYLANSPDEYVWDVQIGCYATAHSGSPNKEYDKIWIPVRYVGALCKAIDEDKDPQWVINNATNTKLSYEHKKIIEWLKKIKVRHEGLNETIIEKGSSNKLGFKKTLAGQQDQYVLVFNYGTSAVRLLDDIYYMAGMGIDPTTVEYDGVDDADLTEKQRKIKDNSDKA